LHILLRNVTGLADTQSVWVNSFEDYIDDFVYFVTTISKQSLLPTYLIAHSLGGLIASIAMPHVETLISRVVLIAPMIRNKCAIKLFDYKYYVPQQMFYTISKLFCYAGLGRLHALTYYKEKPTDKLNLFVTTSDKTQLGNWQLLKEKYPQYLMCSCLTNDWVRHAIKAQNKFSNRYSFFRTNTLILRFLFFYFFFCIYFFLYIFY
jgi:lysophospholipase